MTTIASVIRSDPDIHAGTPVFVDTRVPVRTFLDYLAAGDSLEEFLDHFPTVPREQALRVNKQAAGLSLTSHAILTKLERNTRCASLITNWPSSVATR